MVGNFAAGFAKKPELELDSDETRKIAEAAANVARQYEIPIDEKTAAWIGLAGAIGAVYGSKIMAMKINGSLAK